MIPPPPTDLLDGAALFLDFDGTLVPLTDAPDSVVVDDELRHLLSRIRDALGGRLAIVSGRSVETLRDRFGFADFLLSGSHGLEFARPGEAVQAPARMADVDEAEAVFEAFVIDKPGVLVERKSLSVGLHFRQAPIWAEACRALAEQQAERSGLFLQQGKMMYELRPGGADKGSAVARLMADPLMASAKPVFMGDDVTDEEGFLAANRLGGGGILIGPVRATTARWHLEQVAAVRHYLRESADRLA